MSAPVPAISIVVCTYNQEDLLKETLDSIVSQDFPAELYEVVVGEDKSTDNTAQVLKEYAEKYPQIRPIYNEKNMGVVKNYINVLKHCHGKYIMGCGGDDYWLPEKMRFQFDFMEENPDIAMIYGNWYCLKDGEFFEEKRYPHLESMQDLLRYGNCICAPSTCWRRAFWQPFLKETDFENRSWFCEDLPLWLYLAQNAKIKHIDRNFCVYRIALNSASRPFENPSRTLKNLIDTWDIRLFFTQKYLPEQNAQAEITAAGDIFEKAFQLLLNAPYSSDALAIAQKYLPLRQAPISKAQRFLLFCARNKRLWNFLMALRRLKNSKKN